MSIQRPGAAALGLERSREAEADGLAIGERIHERVVRRDVLGFDVGAGGPERDGRRDGVAEAVDVQELAVHTVVDAGERGTGRAPMLVQRRVASLPSGSLVKPAKVLS